MSELNLPFVTLCQNNRLDDERREYKGKGMKAHKATQKQKHARKGRNKFLSQREKMCIVRCATTEITFQETKEHQKMKTK
jgi:hypothetical protein